MIVRNRPNWFAMLFVLRGSILPRIAVQLTVITLFSVLITALHGKVLDWKVSLNFVPFSLIGLTLAIFLSFRNNTSYDRFWEARKLWQQVQDESRSLAREALTLTSNPEAAPRLVYQLCAFVHLLKHQLRHTSPNADLKKFLDADQMARLERASFRPAMALQMAGEWLGDRVKANEIHPPIVTAFAGSLSRLTAALGGCERIAHTPIPFTYAVVIHRSIYLYCFWLPFGLLDSIGLMTPVIVCFIAYTFFALEALGAELEDPFGEEANDLPLQALAHEIEASLLDMIDEQPRTDKPQIRKSVLQ